MATTRCASMMIAEMREFAAFAPEEQRYISYALDIGLARRDAFRNWTGVEGDSEAIRRHYVVYNDLPCLRAAMPSRGDLHGSEAFFVTLLGVVAHDLGRERIGSFSALRFLYERLLGSAVRPWLPAAFCAAAALPQIPPHRRKLLLHSLSEAAATAAGWSLREPVFLPDAVAAEAA
ncbi:hypothetical protein EYB45_02615 [Erythrobacteraceae bacterium CFH 75059]|uniref:hypothetical protein n=1 Tax=Qipengyuania thermophila TaxID=2509361 RepID=UPI0010224962|nr:hypothetical protein [Qipengyuania thermophila]TCD06618.1 hypothetical protein EYB45_02615 [Erythrobacteraceae bacterium CFH 75059]